MVVGGEEVVLERFSSMHFEKTWNGGGGGEELLRLDNTTIRHDACF